VPDGLLHYILSYFVIMPRYCFFCTLTTRELSQSTGKIRKLRFDLQVLVGFKNLLPDWCD
jgi:hypothetical protein